jgi:hypothetical protein
MGTGRWTAATAVLGSVAALGAPAGACGVDEEPPMVSGAAAADGASERQKACALVASRMIDSCNLQKKQTLFYYFRKSSHGATNFLHVTVL